MPKTNIFHKTKIIMYKRYTLNFTVKLCIIIKIYMFQNTLPHLFKVALKRIVCSDKNHIVAQ